MVYKNKSKDMSRSVLPSTARKGAREARRQCHKATRSRVRAALNRYDWDEEFESDDTDIFLDAQRYTAYRGVKEMVSERRGADKIRPLMRWAEAKADDFGDTPAERYAALRALLPEGIIGWHAMTHVIMLAEYDTEERRWRRYGYREPSVTSADRHRILCRAIYNNWNLHGTINHLMKTYKQEAYFNDDGALCYRMDGRWLIANFHDIPRFVNWVLKHETTWGRWAEAGGDNGAGWSWKITGVAVKLCELLRIPPEKM